MNSDSVYKILRDIVTCFSQLDTTIINLPEIISPKITLNSHGLNVVTLPEILDEFQIRLHGKDLKLQEIFVPETINSLTIGEFVEKLNQSIHGKIKNPIVVYVDDEEENIFIFSRKFGKQINLKTFTNPLNALRFILDNPDVGLVITDEVMPGLTGNELCNEVKKLKPYMNFILITANPHGNADLMYNTLRQNRFFEFINKPVDFEKNGEYYLAMIQDLLGLT